MSISHKRDKPCGPKSGFTLFVYEASNILVDDKNIHFVIMRFKG